MQSNVGTVDRILRAVIGVSLLSLIFLIDSNLRWIGLIGLVTLFTAVTSWCPAYRLLSVSTRSPKQE